MEATTVTLQSSQRPQSATTNVWKYGTVAAATLTLWTPTAGKQIALTDLILSVDTATTVVIYYNTTATTIAKFSFAAQGGMTHSFRLPVIAGAVNHVLYIDNSAGNLYATAVGYEL